MLATVAGSPLLWAQEMAAALENPGVSPSAQEMAFRGAISTLESNQGAYSAGLSEQLLSLGLALQAQGRHTEAVDLFKRGVHLARINDGLHSPAQIPPLQGQIASYIALGSYTEADERQHYMYGVQLNSMDSGQARTAALMQQANWQHNAYRLGIGEQGFTRLMNMWDLYRLALNDIITREGNTSTELLAPLHGMLQAQYLISSYKGEDQGSGSSDDLGSRQQLNRFNAYRAQSYQKGRAVILAIYDIERAREDEQSVAPAKALVMLGDWQLWHEERESAWQTYQDVLRELAERDDAQMQAARLFGEPVALPDIDGIRSLPPTVDTEQGDILLEFGVTERGRVVNLERLDTNEGSDGKANRLMRRLRKTQFRPRFDAGEAIETDKLVRAYEIK